MIVIVRCGAAVTFGIGSGTAGVASAVEPGVAVAVAEGEGVAAGFCSGG